MSTIRLVLAKCLLIALASLSQVCAATYQSFRVDRQRVIILSVDKTSSMNMGLSSKEY